MKRLQKAGYDFEAGSRAALEGKFGGASVVLLRDVSEQARLEPALFVQELSRMFGRGTAGFLEPIAKYGRDGLFPPADPGKSSYDALLDRMGPPTEPLSGDETLPLHDHRVKDEQDNYPDNAN